MLEVPVSNVATVVVVLVMVTVIQPLSVDVRLVMSLVALDELETLPVAVIVFEDDVLSVVELRLVDVDVLA